MMADGKSAVCRQPAQAYIARIDAPNKQGPGLNAVSQLNPDWLNEAKAADKRGAPPESSSVRPTACRS